MPDLMDLGTAEAVGGTLAGTGVGTGVDTGGGAAEPPGAVPCRVVVCRDCCCGTVKVTGADHAAQTARLREAAPVGISACLDVCEQANVIVVRPSAGGRAAGGRPVWLGLVNDPAATEAVADWIRAGGPGVAPRPPLLDRHVFPAPGRPAP